MAKRLYRSRENSFIGGVCGGMGEYFDIDPVLVRIVAVLLAFADGIGLIAYIIAWIAVPRRPEEMVVEPVKDSEFRKYLPGVALVILGILFLTQKMVWWFHFEFIWPLGLIALGLFLILRSSGTINHKGEADESIKG